MNIQNLQERKWLLVPSLRDYSDAYVLVTGNIAAVEVNNTKVVRHK